MFTATVNNPIKYNIPATEILLNDRLITNDDLKRFFIEIPKRIDLIEKADDVSDNLDALALTNDVQKNKEDLIEVNEAIKLINDNLVEIDTKIGDSYIRGNITSWISRTDDILYGTGGNMLDYLMGIEETALELKNEVIPNIEAAVDAHEVNITSNINSINLLQQQVLTLENLCSQIEVNAANITVINSLVASMNAQIEQVRFEMNNTLASFENRLKALENK